VRIAAVATKPK